MSVRHFTAASSELITLSLGALGFAFGPGTVAMIVRPSTVGTLQSGLSAGATNAVGYRFIISDTSSKFNLACNATAIPSLTSVAANNWYLLAASKDTGTVAPRFHIYDYAANAWVHENGASTAANSSVPITRAAIGVNPVGTGSFYNGDIAAAGVWNVVLTDTQVEALLLFLPAVSKGLWRLNQDVTTENVLDMSGGGANQSAIVGTSVTAVVQDVGMFNVAPPKPFEPRVGSYGLQAANRAATW